MTSSTDELYKSPPQESYATYAKQGNGPWLRNRHRKTFGLLKRDMPLRRNGVIGPSIHYVPFGVSWQFIVFKKHLEFLHGQTVSIYISFCPPIDFRQPLFQGQ